VSEKTIGWYAVEVPRGLFGVLGKKRVLVCSNCTLGPCLEGQPKCLSSEGDANQVGTGAKNDWYKTGDEVSFEEAAETEFNLKNTLDNDVVHENVYGSAPHERQAPCRRRKGSYHS
jgi:hypothetical protein